LILKAGNRCKRFGFGSKNGKGRIVYSRRFLLAIGLLLLVACSAIEPAPLAELRSLTDGATARFLYPSSGGKAEAYLVRPRGSGPFPLMILLHGHNLSATGAQRLLPAAEILASELCFASLAISLPGYGDTEVNGGPLADITRDVVLDAVAVAKQLPWIDPQRLYIYGFSRGAVVAAALINQLDGLKGALLHSGAYDLGKLYQETSSTWLRKLLNPNGDAKPTLQNLLPEAANWQAPTLIMHGQQDSLIPVSQAMLLDNRLEKLGKPHKLVVFPERGHFFPLREIKEQVFQFLKENGAGGCPVNDP
jgi:dipeptidyl aminopeptidase/acylaminoacyl peptidase